MELHLFELVKTVSYVLRCGNPIQGFNELNMENEVNKFSEMRSTARRLQTRAHKHSNVSTVVTLRKKFNNILNYHPNFLENKKNSAAYKKNLFNHISWITKTP